MVRIFKSSKHRIPELDGLRGLALLMVLTYHYVNNPLLLIPKPSLVEKVILKTTYFTYSALDLFFVISGYLIAKILLENRNSPKFFSVFYLRRVVRILPLFYLLLTCYLLLKYSGINDPEGFLFGNELPLWSYFAYIPNYMMAYSGTYGARILTPTWSLGVDEQFYLIAPAILFLVKKRWIPYFLIPLIVAAPVFRASTDLYYMKILPFQMRMDSLFVGVFLAFLVVECDLIERLKKHSFMVLSAVLTTGVIIFILTYQHQIGALDHSLFNLLYALILIAILCYRGGVLGKFLRIKAFQFLGLISYGVYLFHQFISGILHALLLNQQPRLTTAKDLGVLALSLFISILIGYVLHVLIEKPLIRWGHQFKYN